ncbi:hypothetical protein B1R94_27000 [Mycolicibacterium litorale]|nr:hypothetical protein B1R94_27000 [Mycolicibacterium litorale]
MNGNSIRLDVALDVGDRVPLYYQLAQALSRQLRDGRYPVGSALEPERQLACRLGVSRNTVRAAMAMLEQQGIINCAKGVPHTVAGRPAVLRTAG